MVGGAILTMLCFRLSQLALPLPGNNLRRCKSGQTTGLAQRLRAVVLGAASPAQRSGR
jgi:hypothetical protein